MTFFNFLLVFIGGGIGSGLRWAISELGKKYWNTDFPYYTLLVNVVGCILLAYLHYYIGKNISAPIRLLFATGFCGGFTTFSTFSLEVQLLLDKQMYFLALLYVLVSISLGVCSFLIVKNITHS